MKKLIILLLLPFILQAQKSEFTGKITDAENNAPLPNASILVAGTNYGTVSNLEGIFTLKLSKGSHTLITRYIGYQTDTLKISAPQTEPVIINLDKQAIVFPEIVVTDEDPAYRIIREAIKRKKINKEGLKNFEYDAYSKKLVRSAGEIALIEEAFIKGYNNFPEWEKEFILKTHKTENRKKEVRSLDFNINDRYYLDFSADTLDILMNKVYLPIADNAFDHYDYKLLNTIKGDRYPIYTIQVVPRSDIQPLLQGKINIEGEKYSICNVDLSVNKGVRFPYIKDLILKFKQSLGNYSGYWLPDYVEMKAGCSFNLSGIIGFEELSFDIINTITSYKINAAIPDSVINAQRSRFGGYASDTSKNYKGPVELTGTEVHTLRPIPLTNIEEEAFALIDSTLTPDKIVKPTGLLSGFVEDENEENNSTGNSFLGSVAGPFFDYSYLNINRVEEFSFGLKYSNEFFEKSLLIKSYAGYSLGIKKALGSLSAYYNFQDFFLDKAGFEIFHKVKEWQEVHPYSHLLNSASILLGFNDQFNYYLSEGFKISAGKNFGKNFSASINFISENQHHLNEKKYISIFNRKRFVRVNPEINEGFDRKVEILFQSGKSPYEFNVLPKNGFLLSVEKSDKLLKSDFDYYKIFFAGELNAKTFYNELFVAPHLQINAEAGYVKGKYGVQHILTPTATLGFYSPVSSFKGMRPYEFTGDKMAAVHIEHNWRTIIFQSLGSDFLTNLELDIITGAGGLFISNKSDYLNNISQKPYWEAFIGISRILAILRIDFSYNSQKEFHTTLSTAIIF